MDSLAIRMITIDSVDPRSSAEFWSAATGCPVVADHGDFVMVGASPALGFQRVDRPDRGTSSVHVDLTSADLEASVARLRDLGAQEHETRSVPGLTWTVMTDPQGTVFCVGSPEG